MIENTCIELEEAVLGALMLERDAMLTVNAYLRPEHFYEEKHQIIFQTIQKLYSDGSPTDILLVTHSLRLSGQLEKVGGAVYISSLTNRIAGAANIDYHAHVIIQEWIKREMVLLRQEPLEGEDVFDTFDNFTLRMKHLQNSMVNEGSEIKDLLAGVIAQIENTKSGSILGLPSGIKDLDKIISGFQDGNLYVIAAASGEGKTAFVNTVIYNNAIDARKIGRENVPIAFWNGEMPKSQLVIRFLSTTANIDNYKINHNYLSEYDWLQVNNAVSRIEKAKIYLADSEIYTLKGIVNFFEKHKKQNNIKMGVIDYLGLIKNETNKKLNEEQEIAGITRELKLLAKRLEIPILLLAQFSKEAEKNRGGRPVMANLKGSSAIYQDADVIIFPYRAEYHKILEDENGKSTANIAELIVEKQRNGATNSAFCFYSGPTTCFSDTEFMPDNQSESTKFLNYRKPDEEEAPF
jgi:replicative DNA helicase